MSQLTYIEDLAKELAEEFELDYEEALEICKLNIDYIYSLMEDPRVVTINLPLLGNLCFNYKKGKYSRTFRRVRDVVDAQTDLAEKLKKENKDAAHARNSYLTIIKRYFYPDKEDRMLIKRRELFRRIEDKQNR